MFESISIIWRLVRFHIGSQRRLLVWMVLLTFTSTVATLMSPLLLKSVIDIDIPSGDVKKFSTNLLMVLASYVAATCLLAGQQIVAAIATERLFFDIRAALLTLIVEQPQGFFDKRTEFKITTGFSTNLGMAAAIFRDEIIAGLVEIVLVIGLLLAAFFVYWPIGLLLTCCVALYVSVGTHLHSKFLRVAALSRSTAIESVDLFHDALGAARDIKFFNLAPRVRVQLMQRMEKSVAAQINLGRFVAFLRAGFSLGSVSLSLCVILLAGILIMSGDRAMSIGLMLQLLFISGLLGATVNQIAQRFNRLVIILPILQSLAHMIDLPSLALLKRNVAQAPNTVASTLAIPDTARIEFVDVVYEWPGGAMALNGFNLQINPGEKLAILGPTGSGKSLLLELLMRMRQPTKGAVLFSGIDIHQIEPRLYYSAFGFVGQNNHLMVGTLREFLLQGWLGQTDDDLWQILRTLELDALVKAIPAQLDTKVGLNGWQFSTGDTHRLMLARALLRDPQVLMLDDFTKSMEPEAGLEIIRIVLRLSANRMVICATNEPSVAGLFDRVVSLHNTAFATGRNA